MQLSLCCIGKTDDPNLQSLIANYRQRLEHYTRFDFVVIPDLKMRKNLSVEQQKQKEGELFLKCIPKNETVLLLDEKGRSFDSVAFAAFLNKKQNSGIKKIWLLIGGPYGFSKEIYQRAQDKIALSPMTFSHQMIRLLLVEQLYRAYTIINNQPYHHT